VIQCQEPQKRLKKGALQGKTFPIFLRVMFNRNTGRKGETLDATFSYPETQKENVSRIDSSSPRTAMITDQVEIKGPSRLTAPLSLTAPLKVKSSLRELSPSALKP